jgi:hypothetical protein
MVTSVLCNVPNSFKRFFITFRSVLGQAYYGLSTELSSDEMSEVSKIFAAKEVIQKGFLADYMFQETADR